eukprot:3258073-Prorocentrum_lima.AAC.1
MVAQSAAVDVLLRIRKLLLLAWHEAILALVSEDADEEAWDIAVDKVSKCCELAKVALAMSLSKSAKW